MWLQTKDRLAALLIHFYESVLFNDDIIWKERKKGSTPPFIRVFLVFDTLLVRFCFAVWLLFSIFSIFCITSFGDCTYLQYQETILYPKIFSHEQTTEKSQ